MANKITASQQAIKDMLAANMDISMFIGKIKSFHALNIEIGITEKYAGKTSIEVKVEVEKKEEDKAKKNSNYMPPEVFKPAPRKVYVFINGCMCIDDEYDNK